MSFKVDANSFPRLQMIGMVATVLLFTLVLGGYFLWSQQQQREQQLIVLEQEILSQQEALLESEAGGLNQLYTLYAHSDRVCFEAGS